MNTLSLLLRNPETSYFICGDGKGCECICKCTHACIPWYVYRWGQRSTLGVSLYVLPRDRASCPPLQSPDSLAHELSGCLPVSSYVSAEVLGLWMCTVLLHVLPFHGRRSGTTDMHHHVWLHVGSWDHISGPCTCVTSPLPLSQLPRCQQKHGSLSYILYCITVLKYLIGHLWNC